MRLFQKLLIVNIFLLQPNRSDEYKPYTWAKIILNENGTDRVFVLLSGESSDGNDSNGRWFEEISMSQVEGDVRYYRWGVDSNGNFVKPNGGDQWFTLLTSQVDRDGRQFMFMDTSNLGDDISAGKDSLLLYRHPW